MGTISNGTVELPIEDVILFHLQAAIELRFRQDRANPEGFFVVMTVANGDHRAMWLHPTQPLGFTYDATEPLELDMDVVAEYADSTRSALGLYLREDDLVPISTGATVETDERGGWVW